MWNTQKSFIHKGGWTFVTLPHPSHQGRGSRWVAIKGGIWYEEKFPLPLRERVRVRGVFACLPPDSCWNVCQYCTKSNRGEVKVSFSHDVCYGHNVHHGGQGNKKPEHKEKKSLWMIVKSVGNYTNYTQKYHPKNKSRSIGGFGMCYDIFCFKTDGKE